LDNRTRSQAITKWANIAINVGYDPNWIEYSGLTITTGYALQNYLAIQQYLSLRSLATIGALPDRSDMNQNIMIQNAFYSPTANSINMLAGLILAPMFDATVPQMLNLASYGMVIGHEITHGFDNSGRLFNGTGAYIDWWTQQATVEFDQRAQCLITQYDAFLVEGQHVNGSATLGENIADLGGLNLAFSAYHAYAQPAAQLMNEYTNDQLFFMYYAQNWCAKISPQEALDRLETDVHSPNKYRVNGPLSNIPDFANAFGCSANSVMGRSLTDQRCEVW